MSHRSGYLVGMPRFRQLRVKPGENVTDEPNTALCLAPRVGKINQNPAL